MKGLFIKGMEMPESCAYCYFKYANGDEFRGTFRNNAFHYGTYTIASDGSYYVGSYKNGQPDGGTWYNKNGKVIENI